MPEPHDRLSERMRVRRIELRMNWAELARAANISYEALRSIRRGDYRPGDITARDLDDALGWRRGSVYAVLDGGEPTLADQEELASTTEERLAKLESAVAELLRERKTPADSPHRDEETG
jgi:DNA-binding XRE family transcriptional regulator